MDCHSSSPDSMKWVTVAHVADAAAAAAAVAAAAVVVGPPERIH